MESRLELAVRELLAQAAAGYLVDLSALEAALEPDPTPIYAFSDEDPSWVIQTGKEGTAGLRVVFAKEAVALLPIGFPGGFALSWQATYSLRDLLVEKLAAAGTYVALAGDKEPMGEEYKPMPDLKYEQACDVEAANREFDELGKRLCAVCLGEIPDSEEGPECDDTGCPGRYGDVEPIDKG